MSSRRVRTLLAVQGSYYLATGLWPLINIRAFQWVTGPKTDHLATGLGADHWLVFTVAVSICAVALGLLIAAWQNEITISIAALAIGAAIGLTAIDLIYVTRRVIHPIYLLDAVLEVLLLSAWGLVLWGHRATHNEAKHA